MLSTREETRPRVRMSCRRRFGALLLGVLPNMPRAWLVHLAAASHGKANGSADCVMLPAFGWDVAHLQDQEEGDCLRGVELLGGETRAREHRRNVGGSLWFG
jgi:hypothetical protein